ncbi:hypothetical protein LY78DRAFT_662053 [Colletotrichum sublineola]|nr:hypothetical protein LY78DRAFT_662053 [Colletotrichum sublineola]
MSCCHPFHQPHVGHTVNPPADPEQSGPSPDSSGRCLVGDRTNENMHCCQTKRPVSPRGKQLIRKPVQQHARRVSAHPPWFPFLAVLSLPTSTRRLLGPHPPSPCFFLAKLKHA